ncbi:MAG: tetratricopeptide repeat protein [Bryobacteraceae bacterium]
MRMSIRIRGFASLAFGIAISSHAIWAQRTPIPPPGGTSTGPGAGRLPPATPSQPNGPPTGSLNGGIYLIGTVLLDDGTPPPDPVTIERVCGGAPRAQAYTDQKGRFSFQIGQTAAVMQDASEDGSNLPGTSRPVTSLASGTGSQQAVPGGPDLQLSNCDLRAVLSGFRSDSVNLGARRLMDDPNVGTIVLHRLANVEGSAVSVTSLQAPKPARQAYERALQDLRKNKLPEAAKELQKAVEIYPNYAAAWYELGRIQAKNQDIEQARKSLGRALAADPKFISPYAQLAELEAQAGNWAALADITSRLIKLDAMDYPMAYFYNATANLNLGQIDTAERSARDGAKLDTAHRYPRLEQVLGMILARKKDYAGAVAHLRNYLLLAPDADDAARMKKELAELERLSGGNQQAKAVVAQP